MTAIVVLVLAAGLLVGAYVCRRNWIVSMPCAAIGSTKGMGSTCQYSRSTSAPTLTGGARDAYGTFPGKQGISTGSATRSQSVHPATTDAFARNVRFARQSRYVL